jgi:hypothetical protein
MSRHELGCALPIGFVAFMIGLLAWTINHQVWWAILGFVLMILLWTRPKATDRDRN